MPSLPRFGKSASYDLVELEDTDADTRSFARNSASEAFEIGDLEDDEHDDEDTDADGTPSTRNTRRSSSAAASLALSPQHTSRPPSNYYCLLTLHLMEDPVWDGCGHCFDRDAITTWMQRTGGMCPISRKPLSLDDLTPATDLRDRISQWREHHLHQDVEQDLSRLEETNSHSQLELMLLPQERRVLSIIKLRKRIRTQKESYIRCVWLTVFVTTVCFVTVTFVAMYLYDVELRGPL